jgi:hypothetical protein
MLVLGWKKTGKGGDWGMAQIVVYDAKDRVVATVV